MAGLTRPQHRELRLLATLCPLLLLTLAFRCPGPDPEAETPNDGGGGEGPGGGGPGPMTQSSSQMSSTGSGPCDPMMVDGDPMNCGACGRACSMMNVDRVDCEEGLCYSSCQDGFDNDSLPPAPTPDDGCETPELPPHKRVFLTSDPHFANFGNALAADAICQGTADAIGMGGTWMAWVSDTNTWPALRFNHSSDPYLRLDGVQVAADWDNLIDGFLDAPINYTELGESLTFHEVWTGTTYDGLSLMEYPCADWIQNINKYTATVGRTDLTDSTWSGVFIQTCERDNVRLYCFEQ
jgi:hypothetical protein